MTTPHVKHGQSVSPGRTLISDTSATDWMNTTPSMSPLDSIPLATSQSGQDVEMLSSKKIPRYLSSLLCGLDTKTASMTAVK